MRCRILILNILVFVTIASGANAGWERPQGDDGLRFIISVRGGGTYGTADIKNNLGDMVSDYYPWGDVNFGDIPAAQNFNKRSWVAGTSIGLTVPKIPQFRVEGDWLHIYEVDYNVSPLFSDSTTNPITGQNVEVGAGAVNSTVSTDIFSAMFYFDFFRGNVKPANQLIPYIGFGVGLAASETVLNLNDLYGNLSDQASMQPFGEGSPVLNFYSSESVSSNISGSVAAGFSYRIVEYMFVDLGVRLTYIPKIQWALNNKLSELATEEQMKNLFSAQNIIYTSIMLGLRFEF